MRGLDNAVRWSFVRRANLESAQWIGAPEPIIMGQFHFSCPLGVAQVLIILDSSVGVNAETGLILDRDLLGARTT